MMRSSTTIPFRSVKRAEKAMMTAQKSKDGHRTALNKCAYFEALFPYRLISNEWIDKFPVGRTKTGRVSTYNPDYFCPKLNCYIEVTTSKANIIEQGERWAEAIKRGLALRVFWWEGEELTSEFKS